MAAIPGFRACLLTLMLLLGVSSAFAQDELRKTFFKDADIAKAAAEAVDAKLLAPRSFARGMTAYNNADNALARGRNIETVRSYAADATQAFSTATTAAELGAAPEAFLLRPSPADLRQHWGFTRKLALVEDRLYLIEPFSRKHLARLPLLERLRGSS